MTKTTNWQERFDEKYYPEKSDGFTNGIENLDAYQEKSIKKFISDLLEAQREEIIKEVKNRIPEVRLAKCNCKVCVAIKDGYNIARENILLCLKENK